MGNLDVVKLPAHMRPASRFLNATTFVDLLETCVSICLQRALELTQVCLRMFPLAIRCVGEPHRRWCLVSYWPIVSHVWTHTKVSTKAIIHTHTLGVHTVGFGKDSDAYDTPARRIARNGQLGHAFGF